MLGFVIFSSWILEIERCLAANIVQPSYRGSASPSKQQAILEESPNICLNRRATLGNNGPSSQGLQELDPSAKRAATQFPAFRPSANDPVRRRSKSVPLCSPSTARRSAATRAHSPPNKPSTQPSPRKGSRSPPTYDIQPLPYVRDTTPPVVDLHRMSPSSNALETQPNVEHWASAAAQYGSSPGSRLSPTDRYEWRQ